MKITSAAKIVQSLLEEKAQNEEKLLVPILAQKAVKVAQLHPQDITSQEMARLLSKKAQKGELTISQKDLNIAYQTFYHAGNRFQDEFQSELGKKAQEFSKKKVPGLFDQVEKFIDPLAQAKKEASNEILENYFTAKLSKEVPQKFTKQAAFEAQMVCESELQEYQLSPKKTSIAGGNQNFILCLATYETPKGESNFVFPVEVVNSKILRPSIFLSASGPIDLTKENLQQEIHKSAGKSLNLKLDQLLSSLEKAKFGSKEENQIEKALAKKAMQETSYFDPNGIVMQLPQKTASLMAQLPKQAEAEKFEQFTKHLTSQAGVAELKFGKDSVEQSRNYIKSKLASCGYNSHQIGIVSSNDNSVTYSAAFGNQAIRVPVKMSKKAFSAPEMIVAGGSVYDFSAEGISQALENDKIDGRALIAASPVRDMAPNELLNELKKAAEKQNYKLAEEALFGLQKSGHQKSYAEGYQIYLNLLNSSSGPIKTAAQKSCCSKPIKVATSQHLVCSHTNLPLEKVYQDSMGRCRPLYRQAMKDDYQGANFMHYQLFWGKEV